MANRWGGWTQSNWKPWLRNWTRRQSDEGLRPSDAGAVAIGADRVAKAIAAEAERRNVDITLVRTGTRGMFWLEPLVEVETVAGRVGYGPVTPAGSGITF